MKKRVSLFLVFCLLLVGLNACTPGEPAQTSTAAPESSVSAGNGSAEPPMREKIGAELLDASTVIARCGETLYVWKKHPAEDAQRLYRYDPAQRVFVLTSSFMLPGFCSDDRYSMKFMREDLLYLDGAANPSWMLDLKDGTIWTREQYMERTGATSVLGGLTRPAAGNPCELMKTGFMKPGRGHIPAMGSCM